MAQSPVYLVVIDDSPESRVAMRFAVQRAAHVEAVVKLVSVVGPTEFLHFGRLQSEMAAQARAEAAALLEDLAGEAEALAGCKPEIVVLEGDPAAAILGHVRADPSIRALVLGTATRGPSALVSFFAGEAAASLPCILMLVPGGLEPGRIASLA